MATIAIDSLNRNKCPYLYMKPGSGKSFVILLTLYAIARERDRKPLTVALSTVTQLLIEQMMNFSVGFDKGAGIQYRVPSDFTDNADWDLVFCDEAYHMLYTQPIKYEKGGKLAEFFRMGSNGKQRCYLGGDYTPDLEPIMRLIDPKVEFFKEYPSQFELMGQQAYNTMKVLCRGEMNALKDDAIKAICEGARSQPVIVFGMLAYRARFTSIFKDMPDMLTIIETEEEVRAFKRVSNLRKRCVILLADVYAFGIDFRFGARPMCVVFNATLENRYMLR